MSGFLLISESWCRDGQCIAHFDATALAGRDQEAYRQLIKAQRDEPWEVMNQAAMHSC